MSGPTLTLPCESLSANAGATAAGQSISALVLVCSRIGDHRSAAARVRTLAQSQPDWAALLAAAASNGVAPLFCKRLEARAGDLLPAVWRERFRREFMRNTARNLFLTAELFNVLGALDRRGLQAVPFKGPVLAEQTYGDIALRQFADLDVVLPHRQMVEAHRVLLSLGYRSERTEGAIVRGPIPGQYAYRSESGEALLELHTEKTMRYLPVPLDWEGLIARLETVPVGGQLVRTFSLEDTLLLLCVHGTKHFWSRLGWICDIAELVQVSNAVDWALAERISRKLRCRRMWLLGLALANEVLDASLPDAVARQIQLDSSVTALSRRVREQFLNGDESEVSASERLQFRVASQDTLAEGLRQLSAVATRPTEQDWSARELPRWARALYVVLRPWRIICDLGFRSPRRKSAVLANTSPGSHQTAR